MFSGLPHAGSSLVLNLLQPPAAHTVPLTKCFSDRKLKSSFHRHTAHKGSVHSLTVCSFDFISTTPAISSSMYFLQVLVTSLAKKHWLSVRTEATIRRKTVRNRDYMKGGYWLFSLAPTKHSCTETMSESEDYRQLQRKGAAKYAEGYRASPMQHLTLNCPSRYGRKTRDLTKQHCLQVQTAPLRLGLFYFTCGFAHVLQFEGSWAITGW